MSEYWKARQSWPGNPEASLAEARRRVAACAERNDTGVYFGDLDLDRLPEDISTLTWLTDLGMFGGRITDFSPLAPLSNLTSLQIGSLKCPFPGLDFMSGWAKLQSLEIITPSAVDLKPIAACTMLKRLSISSTQNRIDLFNLNALDELETIENLSLDGTQSESFDVIRQWTRLKFVQLVRTNLSTLAGFERLRGLKSLYIRDASPSDLSPLSELTALEEITLSDVPASDLSPIAGLPLLSRLDISNTRVSDLSPLERLAKVQRDFNRTKRNENPFWYFNGLENLRLDKCQVTDIGPLAHLEGLRDVSLARTAISSIDPLRACKALCSLNIAETAVTNLGPHGAFAHLRSLVASGSRIDTLQALEPASALQWLDIAKTGIADLTPIKRAHECRWLNLRGSQVVDITAIIDTGSRRSEERGDSRESLDFRDTPASRTNDRLAELAALADESSEKCFFETKAYLRETVKAKPRPNPRAHLRAFTFGRRPPPQS